MALLCFVPAVPAFSQEIAPPIPSLSQWEDNMKSCGKKFMSTPINGKANETLVWYYDGIKVYYQIAEYTKDKSWLAGAMTCRNWYRDKFIFGRPSHVDGWRMFPHGLMLDYMKTADENDKKAVGIMEKNGAFSDRSIDYAKNSTYNLKSAELSREVAYNINVHVVASALGVASFSKPDPYIDIALGHIKCWNDWMKSRAASFPTMSDGGKTGFQPFMAGLTSEALIRYYESKDADAGKKKEIIAAITELANLMWDAAFLNGQNTFYYESNKKVPAPDLNLLICPLYGWLWHRTGDKSFIDKGDKLFVGGVAGAYLSGGKQFSQNYRWSFDYVKWRKDPVDLDAGAVAAEKGRRAAQLKRVSVFPNPYRVGSGMKLVIDYIFPGCIFTINDASGKKVIELNFGKKAYLEWDGMLAKDSPLPAGTYSYAIKTPDGLEKTGKLEVK